MYPKKVGRRRRAVQGTRSGGRLGEGGWAGSSTGGGGGGGVRRGGMGEGETATEPEW